MLSETPGKLLVAARESQSLSQADIAKQTRLSTQTINDIENDVYDRFGAATFVRGYLRSYARAVNVSEEKILAAWEALDVTAKLVSPAPLVVEGVCANENTHHQVASSNAPSRTVMVIGALVVLSAIVWWQNQSPMSNVSANAVALAPKPVVVPQVVASSPVIAKTETFVVTPLDTKANAKVVAKKVKHTVVAHHPVESMHVTYTLKPVSPTELASDH